MKDSSVIIKDVDRHEDHDTTDPNMPRKDIVAVTDVAMSAAPVMFDEELSYAEDHNDDYDDDDDDGQDTKKFPTPVSKHSHAGSEETDLEVYYGDLRTFFMINFPPIQIDLSKLKGSDFSSDEDNDDSFSMSATKE
jgi:hypothetical protein